MAEEIEIISDDVVQRVAEFFDKELRGEEQRKSLILSAPQNLVGGINEEHAIKTGFHSSKFPGKGLIYFGSTPFNESTKNLALTQAEIEGLILGTLPAGGMCLECRLCPPNVYRNTDGTICICKSCYRKMTGKKE